MSNNEQHIDYDLLVLYLTKEANSYQVEQVESWLRESESNKVLLDELEKLWLETGKITPSPVVVDADIAWNKVFNRIQPNTNKETISSETKKETVSLFKAVMRIAAVFILTLGILGVIRLHNREKEQILVAGNIALKNKKLPDETLIELNSGAKLSYPKKFKGNTREVTLEGEAFFNVAEDKEKPFIIHTKIADIIVLGTSFNVNAESGSNRLEVFVESGTVELAAISSVDADTSNLILEAGMAGVVDLALNSIERVALADENILFWKTNKLVFEGVRLLDVFALLEDNFDVEFRVTNQGIMKCELTGTYEAIEVDIIARLIADTFGLNLVITNNTYTFDGLGCE